jgi:hypothetical protein
MAMNMTLRIGCLLGIILALAIAAQATAQTGYYSLQPGIHAYGYAPYPYSVYNPRRAYRQALRYGYPPLFQAWPPVPGGIYGYPYYGSVYRPWYGQPSQMQVPTPASPETRPPAPPASAIEPIPTPPSEPGPREF